MARGNPGKAESRPQAEPRTTARGRVVSTNPPKVSLERQIRCVKREIAKRQSVYPRWVQKGRMTPEQAADEHEAMAAVLVTLLELEAATRLI